MSHKTWRSKRLQMSHLLTGPFLFGFVFYFSLSTASFQNDNFWRDFLHKWNVRRPCLALAEAGRRLGPPQVWNFAFGNRPKQHRSRPAMPPQCPATPRTAIILYGFRKQRISLPRQAWVAFSLLPNGAKIRRSWISKHATHHSTNRWHRSSAPVAPAAQAPRLNLQFATWICYLAYSIYTCPHLDLLLPTLLPAKCNQTSPLHLPPLTYDASLYTRRTTFALHCPTRGTTSPV